MAKVASIWSRLGEVAGLVATPLLPSHYLALIRPHVRQARVEAIRDEAPAVKTLVLRPARGWQGHEAGQHVRVGLAVDGRLVARTYSISSAPERRDGRIEITVKAQGRVSNALHALEPGAFVTLGAAGGEFTLPEVPRGPLAAHDVAVGMAWRVLFVTAGSGVTPVASMLRSCAARGEMPDVVHVHYARTPADVIFGEELRSLAVDHPSYRLVEIHTATGGGHVSTAGLDALAADWREREAWACGPQALLDTIAAAYAGAGRADQLHVERFRAALAVIPNACGGRVAFATSAVATDADGTTPLLHIAEAAGLAPPHGCRMGICHTCDASLVSGCVRDLRTGTTIDEPGARIQICVCAAAGDVELSL